MTADQQWQPIETAPRDGTMLLTVIKGYRPCISHWFMPLARWTPNPESFMEFEHFDEWLSGSSYEPTHWMQLPEGPRS